MKFVINTPNGPVSGFNEKLQIIIINSQRPKRFPERAAANAFLDKYADAGYGLRRALTDVVPYIPNRKRQRG